MSTLALEAATVQLPLARRAVIAGWNLVSGAEQREIAALLATIDAKLAHHEARQTLLRELFRTLLRDLLTARRRVTGLDLAMVESKS
ncbi:MAG: hypothetical protein PHE83_03760 [Opitutaceae bacterium]|nr:hypothetical protein [Opitutaceae bacterium]